MDSRTLVNDELQLGAHFVEEFDKVFPVKAAFWLKPRDAEGWYLYLVCDQLGSTDTRRLYAEVVRIARQMQSPLFSASQVKLVTSSDWIARDVADIQQRRPVPVGTWFQGDSLGGREIDGAYLYPPPVVQPSA